MEKEKVKKNNSSLDWLTLVIAMMYLSVGALGMWFYQDWKVQRLHTEQFPSEKLGIVLAQFTSQPPGVGLELQELVWSDLSEFKWRFPGVEIKKIGPIASEEEARQACHRYNADWCVWGSITPTERKYHSHLSAHLVPKESPQPLVVKRAELEISSFGDGFELSDAVSARVSKLVSSLYFEGAEP